MKDKSAQPTNQAHMVVPPKESTTQLGAIVNSMTTARVITEGQVVNRVARVPETRGAVINNPTPVSKPASSSTQTGKKS